ncbi:MAG: S41 family peptidase [Caldilineaceae bacterium]
MIKRTHLLLSMLILLASCAPLSRSQPEQEGILEPITFRRDQGGAQSLTGEVTYTNAFFTLGVAQPMVILEDEAGFVDRNRRFIQSPESQTLGQITSDFYQSPFSYSIALPVAPKAELRDVDNDGERDTGVMVYAVAYWTNIFGGPFLEERDLQGGGWSTAYSSLRVSGAGDNKYEVIGGNLLVYAPDDQQGFPSGLGADGKLFTADDPTVRLPSGYTVVNLDTTPFTFDRSKEITLDLIEPKDVALADFSNLSYTKAFDAMIEKMRREYAFTEYKQIDWNVKSDEFRSRFENAQKNRDRDAYLHALSDFAMSIPDGHIGGPLLGEDFRIATAGGYGMAIRTIEDPNAANNGKTIVNFLTPGGPAEQAGIQLKAEILAFDDQPIEEALAAVVPWTGPFSTKHVQHLQQLRYLTRSPLGKSVHVTFRNPGAATEETVTLTTSSERASFEFSSLQKGVSDTALPVEYKLLDDNLGYVKINAFADNELLTVQLWERMIQTFKENGVKGIVIDMRQNSGGNGFLADQMAAYFFEQPLELGNTERYDAEFGDFRLDPNSTDRYILPPKEQRYDGKLAVLVGPACQSACEFFSYDLSLEDRATVVGQYPSAGLGGSVDQFLMPENEYFQFTVGRAVDMNGNIHIEGKGVVPSIRVPVNEETLFSTGDPVLEAGIQYLKG